MQPQEHVLDETGEPYVPNQAADLQMSDSAGRGEQPQCDDIRQFTASHPRQYITTL